MHLIFWLKSLPFVLVQIKFSGLFSYLEAPLTKHIKSTYVFGRNSSTSSTSAAAGVEWGVLYDGQHQLKAVYPLLTLILTVTIKRGIRPSGEWRKLPRWLQKHLAGGEGQYKWDADKTVDHKTGEIVWMHEPPEPPSQESGRERRVEGEGDSWAFQKEPENTKMSMYMEEFSARLF